MIADEITLNSLITELRACTICAGHLPLGPRPIFQLAPGARLLIASQAPGTKAHLSGRPFEDASGERLRDWLQMPRAVFYDPSRVAILPMGLCYPGRLPNGGDAPPRPECTPRWRDRVLPLLPNLRVTLLVGSYAQVHVLGRGPMGEKVRDFRRFLPRYFPLPHPSWRTGGWERRNPWFAEDVLPALRALVRDTLGSD